MDVLSEPVIVLSRAELEALHRALKRTTRLYEGLNILMPDALLCLAVAVNRARNASAGEAHPGSPGGAWEAGKTPYGAYAPSSEQPVRTCSVAEAAQALEVTERRVRQLVECGFIEAQAGTRPMRLDVDSVTAHLERRRRMENEHKAV